MNRKMIVRVRVSITWLEKANLFILLVLAPSLTIGPVTKHAARSAHARANRASGRK